MPETSLEHVVALAEATDSTVEWGGYNAGLAAPELPAAAARTPALALLGKLFWIWPFDPARRGAAGWNPLGELISPGSRVVIKPNWVYDRAPAGSTLECLITSTSVLEAVLEYVALTRPAAVTVGDAPLQGCDFARLYEAAGLARLVAWARDRCVPLSIADFRRTINRDGRPAGKRLEDVRGRDRYVLFDLGDNSLLRPLDYAAEGYRVTAYDPALLKATHRPGRHQYLVAREVLEADAVVNIPKLKCHAKACITGALKNLIGINGHKEYLPHHRKGGVANGGDCYPGAPVWKRAFEELADLVNRSGPGRPLRYGIGRLLAAGRKLVALTGADANLEGAWYGNDTIWRTCLDLNRILLFGAADGTLRQQRQRTVVHITDAIVAGEGEGPLLATPVAAGFLTGAMNAAAADYVHARLMGFDPDRIPIIRNAFNTHLFPVADFSPRDIQLRSGGREQCAAEALPIRCFRPPRGWRGHCELAT